jgi:hypothetical protein
MDVLQEITFEKIHSQVQQTITQKRVLGYKVRLKHFRFLKNSFTSNDLIPYTRTNDFSSLNDNYIQMINLLIDEMLSEEFKRISQDLRESKKNSQENNNAFNHHFFKINRIHDQIQKIVKKSFEKNIMLSKEYKILANSFSIDDMIQYTKMSDFNSLGKSHRKHVNHQIKVKLIEEFQGQNITLSQRLSEYVKRDIIPSLPVGINSYVEYESSDWFDTISEIQKSRVRKLILLEYRMNPQLLKDNRKRRRRKKQIDAKNVKRNGLVVVCADDFMCDG